MAHGRVGPDIVMTIRYVGMPEIRTVTEHEQNRTPDGTSAIDPERSELNVILHGPNSQQQALNDLFETKQVKPPTKQSETPFVQIVLSASPEYFRTSQQGPGQWHAGKLKDWRRETMKWLRAEYGRDLAHVSLHLDEDTPHLHILVVPTYDKKPRRPGRKKRGETDEEFEARKAAARNAPTVRVAGRSSNAYWKQKWCRRIARQSYHKAMEPLGLGYGKDFVGEEEPSPTRKETGSWVREQAAEARDRAAEVREHATEVRKDAAEVRQRAAELRAEREAISKEWAAIDTAKREIERVAGELDRRETLLNRIVGRVWAVSDSIAKLFGLRLTTKISEALDDLEAAVDAYNAPPPSEPPETVEEQLGLET